MKKKEISLDQLAQMIREGFDRVDERFNDLTLLCKEGFDGTVSHVELHDLRKTMNKRDRVFATKLGISLSHIDSAR